MLINLIKNKKKTFKKATLKKMVSCSPSSPHPLPLKKKKKERKILSTTVVYCKRFTRSHMLHAHTM